MELFQLQHRIEHVQGHCKTETVSPSIPWNNYLLEKNLAESGIEPDVLVKILYNSDVS